jgi:hypothetical protein
MVEWLAVIAAIVGIAIVLSIPAALWVMVVNGLVQIARENRRS